MQSFQGQQRTTADCILRVTKYTAAPTDQKITRLKQRELLFTKSRSKSCWEIVNTTVYKSVFSTLAERRGLSVISSHKLDINVTSLSLKAQGPLRKMEEG